MRAQAGRALDDFAEKFHCPKCRSHGAVAHEVTLAANPLTMVIPVPDARYAAMSCRLCGYTEIYHMAIALSVLDDATGLAGESARDVPDAAV